MIASSPSVTTIYSDAFRIYLLYTDGPSEQQIADDEIVIDISNVKTPQISCRMDANPSLKYEWYYNSNKVESAQNLTIPKDHYVSTESETLIL